MFQNSNDESEWLFLYRDFSKLPNRTRSIQEIYTCKTDVLPVEQVVLTVTHKTESMFGAFGLFIE